MIKFFCSSPDCFIMMDNLREYLSQFKDPRKNAYFLGRRYDNGKAILNFSTLVQSTFWCMIKHTCVQPCKERI